LHELPIVCELMELLCTDRAVLQVLEHSHALVFSQNAIKVGAQQLLTLAAGH
jgi:hypothetical protein